MTSEAAQNAQKRKLMMDAVFETPDGEEITQYILRRAQILGITITQEDIKDFFGEIGSSGGDE